MCPTPSLALGRARAHARQARAPTRPRPTSRAHAGRRRRRAARQVPLIPLPLPNVTIYYTLWRVASNHSARKGAVALQAALDVCSDLQRLALARQLQQLQRQGVVLVAGSWAERLAADAGRSATGGRGRPARGAQRPPPPRCSC